ncbi:uncharacterized protein LOC116132410 [Pistacia vera]|uniref:uncharacterized protein LOC116132410 n=1 Tax=Pistacia vera TaxID=55513 RepID=UPI001262AF4A|nr:uncharacterized protein LOC116132410 [Pistacia vera]
MGGQDVLDHFAASLQKKYPGLPPGYAQFVAKETQGDWEKAEKLFMKGVKEEDFVSKVDGKRKVDIPEISTSDAEQISRFLRSTLQGTVGSFWRSLEAGTGLLDTVRDLKNAEAIFALFKDMLCREFTGITITSRNLAEVVALEALTKLRLCDICLFENFVCEYRRYFYQLPGGTQEVMKNTFFAKLPPGWDKAANEAFKLLLEKNQVVDSLGGRIEAVRQLVRTRCVNAKLNKEAKRLEFNESCCQNFDGVPGQYGCESRNSTKHQGWKTHMRRKGSFGKRNFKPKRFRNMVKQPVTSKRNLPDHGRFIRRTGKGRLNAKERGAHKCPHKGKKKAAVRFLEVNAESQTSEFEPVWGYEIDSDDEVYELISDYSDDSDSSEDDSKDTTFEEQSSTLQRVESYFRE